MDELQGFEISRNLSLVNCEKRVIEKLIPKYGVLDFVPRTSCISNVSLLFCLWFVKFAIIYVYCLSKDFDRISQSISRSNLCTWTLALSYRQTYAGEIS